ncbi:acyltransferase domain-containing protein [Amycolatopsis cihanbeyliensis]|uniref:Acyl transferase family protein n=1 Tax=Amycolatopsis cihanbeyliensis TaxID=1128664 RepID=A0A542DBT3_AMYCI|nr:acyltransferase domain-containing protein [Amycolatopsis cihanbeyliensis]TQJ00527.1 acyl transferase family protein [Amycolatopsis cihanbeyliensis]
MAGRPVALLLPGQGAQYPGMAAELYGTEPAFTGAMDDVFGLLGEEGARIRADWLSDEPAVPIDDAVRAQPLLFAIGYAAGQALRAGGIRPDVLLGHSVGELVAAVLAGVIDLPGCARLLLARSAVLVDVPAGGMLAVAAAPRDVAPFLREAYPHVVLGAVNAPRQVVLAGTEPELSTIEHELSTAGFRCARVLSRQPFHSPAVRQAARRLAVVAARLELRSPRVPIRSTRTGRLVTSTEATDPTFWTHQVAEPVLFWPALEGLLGTGNYLLVESGPGAGLTTLARRHPKVRSGHSEVLALSPPGAAGTLETWRSAIRRLPIAEPVHEPRKLWYSGRTS